MIKMNQYLYHYTSIETLALILKNKTIRFNNLLNVDDPEEAETEDLGLSGKHCLVSCWTKSSEDILPMWNMYTSGMKGVRIKMQINPFKKYTYNKGEMHFSEKVLSCIDYRADYTKKVTIAPKCPLTIEVEYTDDEGLLQPKIKSQTENEIRISFEKLGRYKRKHWAFQNEYRYIITTVPWTVWELQQVKNEKEQFELFNRVLDKDNKQICEEIYLALSDDAFENMEILLAPKTTEAEYIIVQALLEKYCPNIQVKLEKSKIRVR